MGVVFPPIGERPQTAGIMSPQAVAGIKEWSQGRGGRDTPLHFLLTIEALWSFATFSSVHS